MGFGLIKKFPAQLSWEFFYLVSQQGNGRFCETHVTRSTEGKATVTLSLFRRAVYVPVCAVDLVDEPNVIACLLKADNLQ